MNNSTQGSRDLTKDEVKKLRLMNHGTKPGRARPGTTEQSKERYIAETRKAAGQTPVILSKQQADGKKDFQRQLEAKNKMMVAGDGHQELVDEDWKMNWMNDSNGLYEDSEEWSPDMPMASVEDSDQENESAVANMGDSTPRRFVFCCTAMEPALLPLTEEEALVHPLVDLFDARNIIPKLAKEIAALQDALEVTVNHFKEITGSEPEGLTGGNYISEYCNIQDQMGVIHKDDTEALRRLGRWDGTILGWWRAAVVDDPCTGRKRPTL